MKVLREACWWGGTKRTERVTVNREDVRSGTLELADGVSERVVTDECLRLEHVASERR